VCSTAAGAADGAPADRPSTTAQLTTLWWSWRLRESVACFRHLRLGDAGLARTNARAVQRKLDFPDALSGGLATPGPAAPGINITGAPKGQAMRCYVHPVRRA